MQFWIYHVSDDYIDRLYCTLGQRDTMIVASHADRILRARKE